MGYPVDGARLQVQASDAALEGEARTLAQQLGLPYDVAHDEDRPADMTLRVSPDGLYLVRDGLEIRGDFTRMLPRLKPGALQRELLVRAAKLKGAEGTPTAVDATAGLGEDALLLAAAGFRVILFERNPIIAALLHDALIRAAGEAALAPIVGRMELRGGDSIHALPELSTAPDIVVLDPMFPAKKSAASRKKLQVLQGLEAPADDGDALLEAALAAHPRKVVVKRPAKGPHLADIKPSYTVAGKSIRYDVYANAVARPL